MTQSADIQHASIEGILEILRSQVDSMPVSPTSARYLRALESLNSSVMVGTHGSCVRSASSAPPVPPRFNTAPADLAKDNSSLIINNLSLALTDWLINQWLMSVPFSTASLYLDIISSIYGSAVKAGQLPKTPLFSELKAQLRQLGSDGWKSGIDEEIFARALRLTKNAHCLLADDAVAADLILLSLTHSLIPLEELALLKKDDLDGVSHLNVGAHGSCVREQAGERAADTQKQVLAIIFNNLSLGNARRRYVFPLRQSERTPLQLKKYIARIANALFRRARLPQSTDPNQTVEALWAYAALRTGIPASRLVSYLGHAPLGLPVLKLCIPNVGTHGSCVRMPSTDPVAGLSLVKEEYGDMSPTTSASTVTPTNSSLIINNLSLVEVGRVFLDNPPRWYAMSLRPGVRFTQVCRRIQTLLKTQDSRLKTEDISLFYPCEEIARAIGKKIVIKQRPFIHSVVFFKAKITDIGPLFAKIGDLAWCYRQSATPGAPYADISERQFQLFQQTIAQFTPDYEVASTGELELKKNDRVVIVGGLFAGHEANVVSTVPCASSRDKGNSSPRATSEDSRLKTQDFPTIYRLNIVGDNGIEWRISVDSRLATPK